MLFFQNIKGLNKHQLINYNKYYIDYHGIENNYIYGNIIFVYDNKKYKKINNKFKISNINIIYF